MNIILFEENELNKPLDLDDPRAVHIIEILKAEEGDQLKGGILNGPLLDITLEGFTDDSIQLSFRKRDRKPPQAYPVTMIIGTPRPPTARRLIKDLTTLGVYKMIFSGTDLNEKSYLSSKLWKEDKYRLSLIEGAQQAGTTLLPWIDRFYSLKKSLESLPDGVPGLFLHGEPGVSTLLEHLKERIPGPLVLALGPERGWTDREVEMLKDFGFTQVQLGERILRTETAALCSLSMVIQENFL